MSKNFDLLLPLDFQEEYVLDADAALDKLSHLLLDRAACEELAMLVNHARWHAEEHGLDSAVVASRASASNPSRAVVRSVLRGTLAGDLSSGHLTAEHVDDLLRDPSALLKLQERFSEIGETRDEASLLDDLRLAESGRSSYTVLIRQGKWEILSRSLPSYLRAILNIMDRPEDWAEGWMAFIKDRFASLSQIRDVRFRDLLPILAADYFEQNHRPLENQELLGWNWSRIIALGALYAQLDELPGVEHASVFVHYIRGRARSSADLLKLTPTASEFTPSQLQFFPILQAQLAAKVLGEEAEARDRFEIGMAA